MGLHGNLARRYREAALVMLPSTTALVERTLSRPFLSQHVQKGAIQVGPKGATASTSMLKLSARLVLLRCWLRDDARQVTFMYGTGVQCKRNSTLQMSTAAPTGPCASGSQWGVGTGHRHQEPVLQLQPCHLRDGGPNVKSPHCRPEAVGPECEGCRAVGP